jgi:D-3-phosphoglycerate dehydrogenase
MLIVVVDSPESSGRDLSVEQQYFPDGAAVRQFTYRGDQAKLIEVCREADAVLTDFADFSREVLQALPKLKIISVAATGWDCVDIKAAKEFGISVCCIDEYCTREVADHTMALILALNRKLFEYDAQVRERESWAYDTVRGVQRLADQTLGIVGMGRIGKAVVERASVFGMNIMAYDPYQQDYQSGVQLVELDVLLRSANIISLHANLDPDAPPLINAGAFLKMDRRPQLINVARGKLIDEKALVQALDMGQVSAAALDVLADEPPKLKNHPLAGRDNVILTPHVAFFSEQSMLENRTISAQNIRHYFKGRFDEVRRFVYHAM